MRVLVTGGAGFIGSHVVDLLAANGYDVVALDVHQAAMVGMGVDVADLPEYMGCNDLGTAVPLAQMAGAGSSRPAAAAGHRWSRGWSTRTTGWSRAADTRRRRSPRST